MARKATDLILTAGLSLVSISCQQPHDNDVRGMYDVTDINYEISETTEVLLTAESGEKLSLSLIHI